MKNLKFSFFGLLMIFALAISFNSCTDELGDVNADRPTTELENAVDLHQHHLLGHVGEVDKPSDVVMDFDGEPVQGEAAARDCGQDVYWNYYRPYHALYVIWFYNPTYQNCINMQVAYCNYLIAYHNCYGGGPVLSCEEYYQLCY